MNTINDVLLRIEKKLKMRDIRRTDVRFSDLLDRLPRKFPTLLAATAGLRELAVGGATASLRDCLDAIDARITQCTRMKLERELSECVRSALASEREAAILARRLGWIGGRLPSHAETAAAFSISPELVRGYQAAADRAIQTRGAFVPNLMHAIDEVQGAAPCNDKQLTAHLHRLGISAGFLWEVETFLEAANLFHITHQLYLMPIGGNEFLTRIHDPAYPERVIVHAHRATAGGRRAAVADVASAVEADIKQPVKNRDVRIVVALLDGVKFHGNTRDSFSFRW